MKATYIAIAAVAPALLLSGGTLTWNGGETWDSLTASWVDETGEPSVWTDGSVASFPDGGTIALAADVNVSSLLVGGRSFTLSGEGVLRVEEGGAIVVSTPDATIACPVQTAGALSVQSGSELISGIEGVYLSTNEWRKVAEGVSLDTLKNLSMTDHSKGWNAEGSWNLGNWVDWPNGGVQTVDSFGTGLTDRKLRIISQSEEKVLVEYRRLQENYSVRLIAAMLIEFRSEGDGILAKVAASKTIRIPDGGETNISNYDTYSYENLGLAAHAEKGGKDWPFLIYGDAPWTNETLPSWKGCGGKAENWPESDLVGAIGDFTGFKFQGKSQLVFSGAFQAGGALSLEDGHAGRTGLFGGRNAPSRRIHGRKFIRAASTGGRCNPVARRGCACGVCRLDANIRHKSKRRRGGLLLGVGRVGDADARQQTRAEKHPLWHGRERSCGGSAREDSLRRVRHHEDGGVHARCGRLSP